MSNGESIIKPCIQNPLADICLDVPAIYQKDNLRGSMRNALEARTGAKTIPQIFIGKEHIGGATELLDAAIDGSMQQLLKLNSVNYNESIKDDPYSFLPGWLHSR